MTWRSAAASLSLHAAQCADELMAEGDMDGRARGRGGARYLELIDLL